MQPCLLDCLLHITQSNFYFSSILLRIKHYTLSQNEKSDIERLEFTYFLH
jgi:ribosomal protein L33